MTMKYLFFLFSVFFVGVGGVHAAPTPVISSVEINNGASETTSAVVTLDVTGMYADEVRLGFHPDMKDATVYDEFTNNEGVLTFTLRPGAGTRQVCAQLRDSSTGVTSDVVCDHITMKLFGFGAPINPSLSINNGAQITNSQTVVLQLGATNATGMAISNNNTFDDSVWEDFSSTKQWFLTPTQGDKTVYVMYGAANGTVGDVTSVDIEYIPASAQPSGSVTIAHGVAHTETMYVSVQVSGQNADQVHYATQANMSDAGGYRSIEHSIPWVLKPGVGVQQVCVEFRDSVTTLTSDVVCDSISVQTDGMGSPTNYSIGINKGASETATPAVSLQLPATGAAKVAISDRSDFHGAVWQTYSEKKSWSLLAGKGLKTVHALFASDDGVVSSVVSDSIYLSSAAVVPPVDPSDPAVGTSAPPATPSLKRPLATGLSGGMLVKKWGDSAVYYVGEDGYRYVFPHQKVFLSWYSEKDLSTKDKGGLVVTLTASTLASMPIGGNVTYRPGHRMVKIQSDESVYVVDTGGVLRWVSDASVAAALYGVNWADYVDDISDAFFVNYGLGKQVTSKNDFSPASVKSQSPTITKDKKLSSL